MTGKLITFEGINGSGKTTQILKLKEYLTQKGYDVICTREPGGTPSAEKIRDLLLHDKTAQLDAITELLLFFAARRDHCVNVIWPSLKHGKIVISDRFADSTLAFQCYASSSVKLSDYEAIHDIVLGAFYPDLTFIFDAPLDVCASRMTGRDKDRIEQMSVEYHDNVRNAYLKLYNEATRRGSSQYSLVDASQSIDTVFEEIKQQVDQVLFYV